MPDATFACPDLTTFAGWTSWVLSHRAAAGACIGRSWPAVCSTRTSGVPPLRLRRSAEGHGDHVGWRTSRSGGAPRRWKCGSAVTGAPGAGTCGARTPAAAAEPRAKLSRRGLRWALEGIVCQHLTVARVAEGLGVSWNTANDAVLAEGKRSLIDDPGRFDGVTVIGVDEHAWRHTRRGDKYVTVIIDLTGIRDGTGPARLLDMVEGRSKQAFQTWLAEREAVLARRSRSRRDGRLHRV